MQVKDRNRNRRNIGVLALVALVCHLALAPAISIANGHPDFAFVFACVIALSIGGETGVLCAFAAGVVFDLTSTGPFGLMALLLPLAAYPLGIEVRDRIAEEPMMTLIPVGIAALGVSLAYNLAMLLYGMTESFVDAVVFRSLPTAFLSFVVYLLFVLAMGRVSHGGGSLRLDGGRQGSHSRYTLGNR